MFLFKNIIDVTVLVDMYGAVFYIWIKLWKDILRLNLIKERNQP
jgi:hypothetical protein